MGSDSDTAFTWEDRAAIVEDCAASVQVAAAAVWRGVAKCCAGRTVGDGSDACSH